MTASGHQSSFFVFTYPVEPVQSDELKAPLCSVTFQIGHSHVRVKSVQSA
jgi:hypothetical protein